MAKYHLHISYPSNERPWSMDHHPHHHIESDEEAQAWARGMAEGLYDYSVTLFKDGEVLPYDEPT